MTESNHVDPLLSALRDDSEALRNHAASQLGAVGEEAIPKLINMFLEDDCVIREAATSALVQMGEPAVDPLIEALKDDEEWAVREQAATALGKLRAIKSVAP
ncbi:MAG TPA: HEAT repeat domain-containing protein, partial [Nitrospirales bacterium]|nr:HEAT repeat domain-containing protein [Nitrospirales bacterium]